MTEIVLNAVVYAALITIGAVLHYCLAALHPSPGLQRARRRLATSIGRSRNCKP